MNRNEAFEKLIYLKNSGEVVKKLNINYQTLYSYRHRLKKKEKLSEENMKRMLLKFGYKLKQEEKWESPI
jgi:hypothetical protein